MKHLTEDEWDDITEAIIDGIDSLGLEVSLGGTRKETDEGTILTYQVQIEDKK